MVEVSDPDAGDWDPTSPPEQLTHVKDPLGHRLQVMEHLPVHRPPMMNRVTVGTRQLEQAADGLRAPMPKLGVGWSGPGPARTGRGTWNRAA